MILTGDGSVWLRLLYPVEDSAEWWVLDRSGDPVGRVRAPLDFRIVEAEDGFAWGVETDDLDVEYIVRRPISPGGAAAD